MLDRLLETGARPEKRAWGTVASVVVHGAIIWLAVVATAGATPSVHRGPGPIWIPLRPPHDPVPPSTDTRRGGTGAGGRGHFVPRAPLTNTPIDIDTPVPTTPLPSSGADPDSVLLHEIGGSGHGVGIILGGTGVASDATVDTPVRAIAERAPAYPEMLRAAGISGSVRVQFVVDTTGRAELSSVRVIESSHELFTRSVLASLRQARFTPGEVSARRVRTLVERSYRFDIAAGPR
jgi:protein TonB